jgi:hypothetical protein
MSFSVEGTLKSLIPPDGTPVLNRIMHVMVARKLGRQVSSTEYFAVRDGLVKAGLIGATRGQGGKIFLLPQPEVAEPRPEPPPGWSEAKLMPYLREYLEGPFVAELDLPQGSSALVQDTSRPGPIRGQWVNPDFVLVSVMKLRFVLDRQIDVHTFELKNETGGCVQAVFEALAQTRFSHFGHVVWHLPENSRAQALLGQIEDLCDRHGIGLIIFRDPLALDSFEIRKTAERQSTAASEIDGFLASRLTPDRQTLLSNALINGGLR